MPPILAGFRVVPILVFVHHLIGFFEKFLNVFLAVKVKAIADRAGIFCFLDVLFDSLNEAFHLCFTVLSTKDDESVSAYAVARLPSSKGLIEAKRQSKQSLSSPALCPSLSLMAFRPFISIETIKTYRRMIVLFPKKTVVAKEMAKANKMRINAQFWRR
ncbi:MAG: hypothetical protein K6G74_00125 [Bacilli bacterium]|nr:hypothetical protein [Bacilli bacterium]